MLASQSNLASTYQLLGRDEALTMRRTVYCGSLKLFGEDHSNTLTKAHNYALCLIHLKRFEEAKEELRKMMHVARRVLGETNDITLGMRDSYAMALYRDASATLDDLREAATTLEEIASTARRVFGRRHPDTEVIECHLRKARAALRARETGSA